MTDTTTTPPPLEQSGIGLFDADGMEWELVSVERGVIHPGRGITVAGVFRKTGRTREEVLAALFDEGEK